MSDEGTDANDYDFLSAIAQKEKLFDESHFKVDNLEMSFFLDCQALKF